MIKSIPLLGAILALTLAGCSNPADDVTEASVGDAVQDTSGATPSAGGKSYVIDPSSTIGFVGSKVTGKHSGGFKTFSGKLSVSNGKLNPNTSIEIDMSSLWADSDRLTGHLKSKDFFDAEKFPTSSFTSTSIDQTPAGAKITGNLDLHGVTKSISFPATVDITDTEVKLKAEFFIKRFDFNIVYKGKANDLIRDEVVINLDIVAR